MRNEIVWKNGEEVPNAVRAGVATDETAEDALEFPGAVGAQRHGVNGEWGALILGEDDN